LSSYPKKVKIVEVGPRDGLQNEKKPLSVDIKVELIDKLSHSGLPVIEAGAFVSPKWVPQMADTYQVYQRISKHAGVSYPVLVPNLKGMDMAISAGVQEIAVFAAASESFSQKNINCSIQESFERFKPVIDSANNNNIKVRGYVSCVMGCPYEGPVPAERVREVAERLYNLGCYEISLGDTIGVGTVPKTRALIESVCSHVPVESVAVHFHDTFGQAVVNIHEAIRMGVSTVDTAVGGLGGCPYAKGATGNVATEKVLYLLDGLEIEHGANLGQIEKISAWIKKLLQES